MVNRLIINNLDCQIIHNMLSIIVAASSNNAIGNNNELLYRVPNDMKRFKELTTGHTIIMGRNTFESLPKGALPNRRNIVLSRQEDIQYVGAEVFPSLEEALDHCNSDEEIFIIGGEQVYKQALDKSDRIYLTRIEDITQEADAFFPEIEEEKWEEISREAHSIDEKHLYPYTFINYIRK